MIFLLKWVCLSFFCFLVSLIAFVLIQPIPFKPGVFENRGEFIAFNQSEFFDTKKYELFGPEDLAFDSDERFFYTGLMNGKVVRVDVESGDVTEILTAYDFNSKLHEYENENNIEQGTFCDGEIFKIQYLCGQVLGIKFDVMYEGIYMANKAHGLFYYHLEREELEMLVNNDKTSEGGVIEFYDDIAPGRGKFSDKVYYSKFSSKWGVSDVFEMIWEHERGGEIMEFDMVTKKERTLIPNFYFPNGVIFVGDDILYATDSLDGRVVKFDLSSERIVSEYNTGINPDNLSYDPNTNQIYVAGIERSPVMEWVGTKPTLVKILAKRKFMMALGTYLMFKKNTGIFCIIDASDGSLVRNVYDESGDAFKGATSVYLVDGYFYIGSFYHRQAVRFKIQGISDQ